MASLAGHTAPPTCGSVRLHAKKKQGPMQLALGLDFSSGQVHSYLRRPEAYARWVGRPPHFSVPFLFLLWPACGRLTLLALSLCCSIGHTFLSSVAFLISV